MGRRYPWATAGAKSAGALLALMLLTASGCSKPHKPNNWAKLCMTSDCSAYPVGYQTIEMRGASYYFRLDTAAPPGANGERFVEFDERDSERRAVYLDAKRFTFVGCCGNLGAPGVAYRVDIESGPRELPSKMADTLSRLLPNGDPSVLEAWDSSFYLLESSPVKQHAGYDYMPMKLISKEPLLFGAHLYVDCDLSCDASLLESASRAPDDLNAVLTGIMAFPAGNCESQPADSARPPSCKTRDEVLHEIPQRLEAFARLIDRAQTKPLR